MLQVGFTNEGRIVALRLDMFSNCGNSLDSSLRVIELKIMKITRITVFTHYHVYFFQDCVHAKIILKIMLFYFNIR